MLPTREQLAIQQEIKLAFHHRGNPGLSPWLGEQGFSDSFYKATGIVHLHLSPLSTLRPNGRVKRSNNLWWCRPCAYLIKTAEGEQAICPIIIPGPVTPHDIIQPGAFYSNEILTAIYREWHNSTGLPLPGLPFASHSVRLGPSQLTDKQKGDWLTEGWGLIDDIGGQIAKLSRKDPFGTDELTMYYGVNPRYG